MSVIQTYLATYLVRGHVLLYINVVVYNKIKLRMFFFSKAGRIFYKYITETPNCNVHVRKKNKPYRNTQSKEALLHKVKFLIFKLLPIKVITFFHFPSTSK